MSGIRNKVVVITGASSGIGEATAIHLAQRGAKLVLGARGLEPLEKVVQRIEQLAGNVAFKKTDVRRRNDLTNIVDLALSRFGKLDVFMNNAGIAPVSLHQTDLVRSQFISNRATPRPIGGLSFEHRPEYALQAPGWIVGNCGLTLLGD